MCVISNIVANVVHQHASKKQNKNFIEVWYVSAFELDVLYEVNT